MLENLSVLVPFAHDWIVPVNDSASLEGYY